MKYISLFLLLCLSFGSCRKKGIPKYEAFKPGKYYYDLYYNDSLYKDYAMLSISAANDAIEQSFFYYYTQYEIEALKNEKIKIALGGHSTGYLPVDHYRVFHGGLYSVTSSFLQTTYGLKIPAPKSGLDSVENWKCPYQSSIDSTPSIISQRDLIIEHNGNSYSTYKFELGHGAVCDRLSKQILYIDENYGLIRYEFYDKETDELKATFTLSKYQK